MSDLNDKIAVVTGGTLPGRIGCGLATAQRFIAGDHHLGAVA